MISSIFNKTKPINFIVIAAYLFVYVLISHYAVFHATASFHTIASALLILALLMSTVFLINVVSKQNQLSENNAYPILLFALCLSLFPQVFTAKNTILAHIFVLLSSGRLLSLKDRPATKQKIFEASFWICIASLFYSWAVLYLVLVYTAIVLYDSRNYKNWLIPLTAILAVGTLRYTYFLWFEEGKDLAQLFSFNIQLQQLEFTQYFSPFLFLCLISLLALFSYGTNAIKKRVHKQFSDLLMVIALFIGLGMALFCKGNEEETSVLFMLFPVSVLFSHYLERLKKKWIKESFLWLLLLMPVVFLLL